ncbi:MAG: hypothetical protein IID55_02280 [Proteobacteria bacterium]|nr:hypothetical protein [Pseudomonadota bacterium]
MPTGASGGYAFICDTGPTGETWLFKDNDNPSNWNGFVNVNAKALLVSGYAETRRRLFLTLEHMGFRIGAHAINRIDYAMDFLAPNFEPNLDLFVTPPGAKVKPYWGDKECQDPDRPSAVFANRRIQTITIGSIKGRQIILYDKRRDSLDKRKFYWFKAWGIDPKDRSKQVWRVELRAGKKELKDRFRISTFDDLEASIGDVYKLMVEQIRYVAEGQTDSNVTRQALHPLWHNVSRHVQFVMADKRSGLTRDQIKEVEREAAIANATNMITAYAIHLGVAMGMQNAQITHRLPELVIEALTTQSDHDDARFQRRLRRARERLHFV